MIPRIKARKSAKGITTAPAAVSRRNLRGAEPTDNNYLRRRLSHDTRSKEFKRMGRRMLITMPAPKDLQARFYEETVVAEGLHSKTGICAQISSGINDERGFFGNGLIEPEDLKAYERGVSALEKVWLPAGRVIEGMFYDHEPKYTDEDGQNHWWSGRSVYTPDDVRFIQHANKELNGLRIPLSQYGIPRVPKTRRMNFFELKDRMTAAPMLEGCSWVQLNHYPQWWCTARYLDDHEAGIRESIQQSIQVYRAIFPGKQIVPIVWTHYRPDYDIERFFSILMSEFTQIEEIKTICYWTNPHADVMRRVYGDRFHTVAPHLRAWLMG